VDGDPLVEGEEPGAHPIVLLPSGASVSRASGLSPRSDEASHGVGVGDLEHEQRSIAQNQGREDLILPAR
jgi:hypothetical protein